MDDPPVAVVGNGNIAGSNLTNVGNQTVKYNNYLPERQIFTLESRISLDAMLNSEARYPAPKCHPSTRKVAQKVVKNWLRRKGGGSKKGIMWMSGAPGVGKSAIVQTVCEELGGDDGSKSWMSKLVHRDRHIDGSFFFGRGLENREKASFFPATIAYQLCRSRTSCRTAINKTIEERPTILVEDFPSQFRHLLTSPAQKTGLLQSPITVVIDGLDECASVPDQVKLLELIFEAVKTKNMRFLIASRPDQEIYAFFCQEDVSQHVFHVQLDEESFKTSEDIKVFLREEFARIRRLRPEACLRLPNGEDWPGNVVIDQLAVESDSQFMFPTLAIAFIDTPFFAPDKQLQILLSASPTRAFSTLDALYHKILSRQPPAELLQEEDDLSEYHEVVMGILRVIIAWSGAPLSAAGIAAVLGKPVDVVQNIVRGPMRSLFKFHTSEPDSPITLCHKSLRDYLLNRKRSEEFFISSAEEDDVFVAILSLRPSSYPKHSFSDDIVMDVLAIATAMPRWSLLQISTFLDVDATFIEHVVKSGPTKLLFNVDQYGVGLCTSSFDTFLGDADRSGRYYLPTSRIDAFFVRALTHHVPSDPSCSYSREFLLDILALTGPDVTTGPGCVGWAKQSNIPQIAALLEVDYSLVEYVMTACGQTKWLFGKYGLGFSNEWIKNFLRDASRSGEFFASDRRTDAFFIRLFSQQLPSDLSSPSFQNTLMGVLTAIVAFGGTLNVQEIASLLDVDRTHVESIVTFGPAKLLFHVKKSGVGFSSVFPERFLRDASRSGNFFISDGSIDALFIRILSRQAPPTASPTHYHDTLMGILTVILVSSTFSTNPWHISKSLGVDPGLVEETISGPAKGLFHVKINHVDFSTELFGSFLQDVNRAGEFCITEGRIDALFISILSRQPPPDLAPSYSKNTLMDVLTMMVSFPLSRTTSNIASALEVNSQVINSVLGGPSSPLFFIVPLLRPALMNADRSGEFFISQARIDALFTRILSRQPLSDPSHACPKELLMGVLAVTIEMDDGPTLFKEGYWEVDRLAAFLDVSPTLVEGVTKIGPCSILFGGRLDTRPSTPFLEPFLKDSSRSGEYFISDRSIYPFFNRMFSSIPPPDGSRSLSQEVLKDVLTVLTAVAPMGSTVFAVAAALDVHPRVVNDVLEPGPTRPLFYSHWHFRESYKFFNLSLSCIRRYLRDVECSGEFYISDAMIDTLFIRILSRPPPLHSTHLHGKDMLLGVMAAIFASPEPLAIAEIITLLDADRSLVEEVIHVVPAKVFFHLEWDTHKVTIPGAPFLKPFLQDAARSGEFFIPPTATLDTIPKPWLPHWHSPSDPSTKASVGRETDKEVDAELVESVSGGASERLPLIVTSLGRQNHKGISVGPTRQRTSREPELEVTRELESLEFDSADFEKDMAADLDQEEYWSADDYSGHDSVSDPGHGHGHST